MEQADNKPEATAALAQSQTAVENFAPISVSDRKQRVRFQVSDEISGGRNTVPYERKIGDPLYRPLRIFTLDPSFSRLEGSIATLKIPYERLEPGPTGSIFEVDGYDGYQNNAPLDLDDHYILIDNGLEPTQSDPRFHQQMVYAVASSIYAAFRAALGRHIVWGFSPSDNGSSSRLKLRPFSDPDTKNAYYDKATGSIRFGYYRAPAVTSGRNLPGSLVFTSLSHDIIAHEITHAVLDGLRSHFTIPSNPDVLAFHEAFADLVALFQHFSYREVVEAQLRKANYDAQQTRDGIELGDVLTGLAWQFGSTQAGDPSHNVHTISSQGQALRSAISRKRDGTKAPLMYGENDDPHELGSVLVSAVFDAFTTIYKRKTHRYLLLATAGSGVLPEGEIDPNLASVLAAELTDLASQFLSICIRAVDYCPPVDVMFGEYLRAMITADYALIPDDPWAYREALVDAFRAHGIFPTDVPNLSEDALLWQPPAKDYPPCVGLSFTELKFRGDPSWPADTDELKRRARALGSYISDRRFSDFGLLDPVAAVDGCEIDPPIIHSVRTTRRAGPDGQVVFDIVAEVTQRRAVVNNDGTSSPFYGGSTVILDPRGSIRYIILKHVESRTRLHRQQRFQEKCSSSFWYNDGRRLTPQPNLFLTLHDKVQSHRTNR